MSAVYTKIKATVQGIPVEGLVIEDDPGKTVVTVTDFTAEEGPRTRWSASGRAEVTAKGTAVVMGHHYLIDRPLR